MRAAVVALLVALAGCPARPPRVLSRGAAAAPPAGGWSFHTLRAEHRVTVDVDLGEGKHERRQLQGAIAVERPDRFRLRALGPGGITLFDLISVGGRVKVLEAVRDPQKGGMRELVEAMAGDLQAAFLLEPAPPGRKTRIEGPAFVVEEPERTVRLLDWRAPAGHPDAPPVATRFEIRHPAGARGHAYTVTVDARDTELDPPLDPALFSE